jgi:hypothetical protein
MKYIFFISIIFFFIFNVNCKTHKDETKDKAILAFALDCKGGSAVACYSSCNERCGIDSSASLNSTTNLCVDSCQSSCSSSCNILGLYFTLQRKP